MKLIVEGRYRRLVLALAIEPNDTHDQPEPQGVEALAEVAGAPERPQLGFMPPSDPTRKQEDY